jgi:hypothetical protein
MSHASFLSACALALSGQAPPAYMAGRGALEASLYFFWAERRAEAFDAWSERHKDDASKAKAKNLFKIGPMMSELDAVADVIGQQFRKAYENTVDFGAHPNYLAFLTNVEEQEGETTWMAVSADPIVIRHTSFATAYAGLTCIAVASATLGQKLSLETASAVLDVWNVLDEMPQVT